MSSFWNWYIVLISLGVIFGSAVLLFFTHKMKVDNIKEGESMGHSFDGIEELNNPLPKWWHFMFWASIVYGLGYLVLYPGLGSYPGLIGWSSDGQWRSEMTKAEETYQPIFDKMAAMPLEELSKNQDALKIGQRLFANNCAICHGSDARGAQGFPNLTDNDWLYGSEPETIKQTILLGRSGVMPPMGEALGGNKGVHQLASYVRSLNGYSVDEKAAAKGKKKFQVYCAVCHGSDAKGNKLIGSANLTDGIWLYGGSEEIVEKTINNGRNGKMPAHKDLLGEEKVHILAAYIYSLSKHDDK